MIFKSLVGLVFLALPLAAASEQVTLRALRDPGKSAVRGNHTVQSLEFCGAAISRMKQGPALWEDIISEGQPYTDDSFKGSATLYWDFNIDLESWWNTNAALLNGTYEFKRLSEVYPTATLWGSNPEFADSNQGDAGTCYFMASISALAEYPEIIKDAFLTQTTNSAGIYAVQFYIRSKPWIVTIDDEMLFYENNLVFAEVGPNTHLWGPIIEKAWAKAQGSYGNAGQGGFFTMGIRAMTGVPVFDYPSAQQNGEYLRVWELIKQASDTHFIVGAGTHNPPADDEQNEFGVYYGHQYTILEAFTLTDGSGNVEHRLYMVRNPWGNCAYHGDWNYQDPAWTAAYKAQVPWGVDPTNSNEYGVFFVEDKDLLNVFGDFQIAHYLKDEGYQGHIYDQDFDTDLYKVLHFTAPQKRGDLYITAESYFMNMIPSWCFLNLNPYVYLEVALDNSDKIYKQYSYFDGLNKPIMIPEADYEAGTEVKISLYYWWFLYEGRDYTVQVYSQQDVAIRDSSGNTNVCNMDGTFPSCFTWSSYHKDGTSAITEAVNDKPNSLWEVYMWSYDWSNFWELLASNWWTLFVWVNPWQ